MRQLERLSIEHLGAVLAGLVGQRAGPSGARGLEFADYRPYTPGDDLRRVDWNIYARLGEAFVKTSPSEAHVDLSLLVDGSRSMDGGRPSKSRYAQRLTAALGAVALLRSDVIQVDVLADGQSWAGGPLNAPRSVLTLIEELAGMRRGLHTDLAASVRASLSRRTDANVVVLVTDALVDAENLRTALDELAHGAGTATIVHVIDDAERTVELSGPVELRDSETGERLLVNVTPAVREQYAARFDRMTEQVRELAQAAGVLYIQALTSVPPLDLLFAAARTGELVAL
jgi:uncharacterized protein (DUF58 family)